MYVIGRFSNSEKETQGEVQEDLGGIYGEIASGEASGSGRHEAIHAFAIKPPGPAYFAKCRLSARSFDIILPTSSSVFLEAWELPYCGVGNCPSGRMQSQTPSKR